MNSNYRIYLAAFGRLLMVFAFFMSGLSKIADPSGTIAYIGSTGAPFPAVGFAVAAAIEIGGSILLLLGYRTRSVAAVLALFCFATALMFHNKFADQNQMIHFLKNISMAGGFLQLVAFGAGAFSLDARKLQGSKSAKPAIA